MFQEKPWVLHDCGILWIMNDEVYEKYRKIFLNEYSAFLYPLVSIIINASGKMKCIKKSIESVINQEYLNTEIIIIYYDNSVKKLTENYSDEYKIILIENSRETDNIKFNEYIEIAKGKYICFLNNNDIYAIDKCNKMIDYFINYEEINMVTSSSFTIDSSGNMVINIYEEESFNHEDTVLTEKKISRISKENLSKIFWNISVPMMKKSFLVKMKYENIDTLKENLSLIKESSVIYLSKDLTVSRK